MLKRLAFTVRPGWDDVADLDRAVGDDHAVDQQFQQRPLLVEAGAGQARTHALAERLGMGCQASCFALTFGIMRKLMLLSVQRLILPRCCGVLAGLGDYGSAVVICIAVS